MIVELSDPKLVEPQDDGKYAIVVENGNTFVLDDLVVEMLFAAYTEGESFTKEEWEQWARAQ